MNQARKASLDATQTPSVDELLQVVLGALDDAKATDVTTIDVTGKTSIADYMVIASGTSSRHVKTLADTVHVKAKEAGVAPLGMEGQGDSEWVLVDLADVLVHIMLPRARTFYALEKLWSVDSVAEPS